MSQFQSRLKELKERSGKTQARIAEDLGVTPQAFSYYVNGREPDYDVLIRIAKYFNVSTDYLLGLSEVRHIENRSFNLEFGLSDDAINNLYRCRKDSDEVNALSFIIGHPLFPAFIKNIYVYAVFDENEIVNILKTAAAQINNQDVLRDAPLLIDYFENADMTDTLMASAATCLRTIMIDYRNKMWDRKTKEQAAP